jgi:hypothetical protein
VAADAFVSKEVSIPGAEQYTISFFRKSYLYNNDLGDGYFGGTATDSLSICDTAACDGKVKVKYTHSNFPGVHGNSSLIIYSDKFYATFQINSKWMSQYWGFLMTVTGSIPGVGWQCSPPPPGFSMDSTKFSDITDHSHRYANNYCSWTGLFCEEEEIIRIQLTALSIVGNIPSSIGLLSNLEWLELPFNSLEGSLSSSIGDLSSLHHLDICCNQLVGDLPTSWANFKNLQYLSLSNNKFVGPVPKAFSQLRLSVIQHIDLSSNALTGKVSSELCSLRSISVFDLSNNPDIACYEPCFSDPALEYSQFGSMEQCYPTSSPSSAPSQPSSSPTEVAVPLYTDFLLAEYWHQGVLAVAGIMVGIAACIGLVFAFYQKSLLIKSSSPVFMNCMLAGSIMLAVAAVLYATLPTLDNNVCRLRAWILPVSLSLLISPVLTKTLRICALWNWGWKMADMTDARLMILTVCVGMPSVLIVGLNEISASTRPTASRSLDSALGQHMYYTQCSDNPTLYAPLFVYFVLLIGTCCFLAFKCRKAPQGFNEASSLLIACSLMFVYGCFIVGVQFVVASNPVASVLLRSFGEFYPLPHTPKYCS